MDESKPAFNESLPQRTPIPFYDCDNQISSDDQGEKGFYNDSDLYKVSVERLRALREIRKLTGIPVTQTGGFGLEWAIDNTPREIGQQFDAHGIAKNDPIKLLNNVLTQGINPTRLLYTMPFIRETTESGALGADHPKTEGGIIIISDVNRKLSPNGITFVGLGEEYMRVVDMLRKKYPDVSFIPWHQIPKTLTNAVATKTDTATSVPETSNENRPYYPAKIIGPQRTQTVQSIIPIPTATSPSDTLEDWVE